MFDLTRTFLAVLVSIGHNEECPNHADFSTPIEIPEHLAEWLGLGDHNFKRAMMEHIQHLNYPDTYKSLPNDLEGPPSINVMLIAPSVHGGGTTTIYERLGIGRIALKRWVEVSPVFETVVLAS